MSVYEQNHEDDVLDEYYQDIVTRPIDFVAVTPAHERVVTLKGTYDKSEDAPPKRQRFELTASARIEHAANLVEYCRNLRTWFDASPIDDALTEAVQALEGAEASQEPTAIEDALGLLNDEDDDDERCQCAAIVIGTALAEDDFDEGSHAAVRFLVDPYIGNEETHYYKDATWARMDVMKGRCALRGVPNGPILRTAPGSSGWRNGAGRCSVRGKWASNYYRCLGGWILIT